MIVTQLENVGAKVQEFHAEELKNNIMHSPNVTLEELSQDISDENALCLSGNDHAKHLSYGNLGKDGHKEVKSCILKLDKDSVPQTLSTKQKINHEQYKNEDRFETRVNNYAKGQSTSNYISREESSPFPIVNAMTALKIQNSKICLQRRKAILEKLNEEEQKKFTFLCEAVAKRDWSFPAIYIIQCLIVSHFDTKEALHRMKKWLQVMDKWKASEVSCSAGYEYLKANSDFISIGGLDPEGRRVYVIHFGNIISNEVLKNFSEFCKFNELLWDSLTINVPEMRAGIAVVADFKGFGVPNWSVSLLIRFLGLIKDKYPLRIRRIYFINTPGYFSLVSRIVMMILPKKFKERVLVLSNKSLEKTIGLTSLPVGLGGTFEKAGPSWFEKRLNERYGNSWLSSIEN